MQRYSFQFITELNTSKSMVKGKFVVLNELKPCVVIDIKAENHEQLKQLALNLKQEYLKSLREIS